MVTVPEPFPLEFSHDVIAMARRFEVPMSQIAKDFGISESCLHRWLKLGDVEEGLCPGITQAEAEEMRKLKKSNLKGTLITPATCASTDQSVRRPSTGRHCSSLLETTSSREFSSLKHSGLAWRASPLTRRRTSQIVSPGVACPSRAQGTKPEVSERSE
jgi:transposase